MIAKLNEKKLASEKQEDVNNSLRDNAYKIKRAALAAFFLDGFYEIKD